METRVNAKFQAIRSTKGFDEILNLRQHAGGIPNVFRRLNAWRFRCYASLLKFSRRNPA
jgi:hypothetical protein